MPPVLLVPHGAEERAVRRAAPNAIIVAMHAGARAAALPDDIPAGLIVVTGLCGALRNVRTGDVAIFRDIVDETGRYTFDEQLVQEMHARLPGAKLVYGCTVDHVVTRATERAALAAAYNADAVDMEGTHVARALAARGRASLIVRVASDDPSFDLPPIEHAFSADGAIRPLHLALAFARQPLAAARFIGDVRRSLSVLSGVAGALAEGP
jgi:nucleoside phosphorylase